MKNLTELLEEYHNTLNRIHRNRGVIRNATRLSKEDRSKLDVVKEEMKQHVLSEIKSGKTLYQICIENFSKIDWRFHALYALIRNYRYNHDEKV